MARHLAIDWDYQQLRIVAATVRAGKLHIEQAAIWQEEQSPNLAEADALGQRLRERLRSAGITPAPALACVGRDRIILREVRYPAVSGGEEAAVIRFQVMKELTDSADEVIIDYTPLGEAAPGEERRALVFTARRELLAGYQALCKAAGLKLLALTPRPFGTLACLRESLKKWEGTGVLGGHPTQAAVALVTPADNWAEFCLVRDDTVVVARSLPAGSALAGEVRRNIAMYTAQSPRNTVSALYLAGNGETATLQESLQQLLAIPIRTFDPLIDVEGDALAGQNRGAFAGAVGLLRAQATGRPLPINFVAPKRPEAARDPNKRRLALIGGVAAFLLIGMVSYCYARLASLDRQIEDLTAEQMRLEATEMPRVEKEERRFQELNAWNRTNISWLDEFYDLTALMPPVTAMQLSELKGEAQPPAREKDKPLLRLAMNGASNSDKVIYAFLRRMADEKTHYVTGDPRIGASRLAPFTVGFAPVIELEKQTPDKYQKTIHAPPLDPRMVGRTPIRPTPILPGTTVGKKYAMPQAASHVHILPQTTGSVPNAANARATAPGRMGPTLGPKEGGAGASSAPMDFQQNYKSLFEQQQRQLQPGSFSPEGTPLPQKGEAAPPVKKGLAAPAGKGGTQ